MDGDKADGQRCLSRSTEHLLFLQFGEGVRGFARHLGLVSGPCALRHVVNLDWHRSADDGRKISRIAPGLLNLKSSVFLGASVAGLSRCGATHSLTAGLT
jgi:hypothetical protein